MNLPLIVIALALVWASVTGTFSLLNLLFGAVLGFGVAYLLRERVNFPGGPSRLRRGLSLALLFLYELGLSAIKVAVLVLRPDMKQRLHPAIVAFPLTATRDGEITLLANLITLTPGTLSLDVSEDRKVLYVHALSCRDRDALVRDIATGFEARVIEVFR